MASYQAGDTFEHYRLIEPIGEGGMGEVFLAEDLNLNRKVAIKFLIDFNNNEVLKKRFQNEARILASLDHPNIVSIFNFGLKNNTHFIVMQYIEGQPLSAILNSRGFGLGETFDIMKSLLHATDAAHIRGVLHRDIKPSNVVIDKEGKPKLVDFGISKDLVNEKTQLTKTDHFIGTLHYLAPEVLTGQRPSPASDIFSLGVVFYEMLCRKHPFVDDNKFKTIENIKSKNIRLPQTLTNLLPIEVSEILQKMLAKNPKHRYQSVQEVIDDFEKLNLSIVPQEILSAMRPEVMILNENSLRLRLLSRGFKTREIGIILSLAAKMQESTAEVNENTVAIGDEEKISISNEALHRAILSYQQSKSRLAKHRTFSRNWHSIQHLVQPYKKLIYAGGLILLLALSVLQIPLKSKHRDPASLATLRAPAKGTLFYNYSREVIEQGAQINEEHTTVKVTNVDSGELSFKIDWKESGLTGFEKRPLNPFVQSYAFNQTSGYSEKSILTGDYNSIFPLKVGKTMTYDYISTTNKFGQFKQKSSCQVESSGNIIVKAGNFFTYKVKCKIEKEVHKKFKDQNFFKTFWYAPELAYVVKVEERRSMHDGIHILSRELENYKLID